MRRPEPVVAARELINDLFPRARQAWLSGSVVLGGATANSDLDITVLLESTEVRRESVTYREWPVELFVHTEESARHFIARDVARRRPTMARLVSTGVPLVSTDDGASLREECAQVVAAGPPPLSDDELLLARYMLTDQLDDLQGGAPAAALDAIAIAVWTGTAELLLAAAPWWTGAGKWLIREVEALDGARGTRYALRLSDGLHAALAGDPTPLAQTADDVLDQVGGRVRSGFCLRAPSPLRG